MTSIDEATSRSEPEYASSAGKATDYPWYHTNIDDCLVPETQELLEKYSNIPRDQQSRHVHEIRERLWAIRSYPCTGVGAFLIPCINRSPAYADILSRIKAGGIFLDIGCYVGHDLRKLAIDGAPTSNLYGIDIVSHWDIGYDLFRDQGRFTANIAEADLRSLDSSPAVRGLMGKVDVISIMAVLHQWSWDGQVEAAKQLVPLSKPGSLVVGLQVGNRTPQALPIPQSELRFWRQNEESFAQLWDQVGRETGSLWETQVWARSWEDLGWGASDPAWLEDGVIVLEYVVIRKL